MCGPFRLIFVASLASSGKGREETLCTEWVGLSPEWGVETRPNAERAYPGTTLHLGNGFTCRVKRRGVRCVNPARHGFYIQKSHSYVF
jgi:hypothetical protein